MIASKRKKMFFIACLLFHTCSYGFDWNKCKRNESLIPGGQHFSSTTSFFSSTGDCSMIGKKSHDEKVFFVQNLEEIKIDVARGGGEYLSAFSSYSSCQGTGRQLQGKYENIFVMDLESSFNNLKKFSCN